MYYNNITSNALSFRVINHLVNQPNDLFTSWKISLLFDDTMLWFLLKSCYGVVGSTHLVVRISRCGRGNLSSILRSSIDFYISKFRFTFQLWYFYKDEPLMSEVLSLNPIIISAIWKNKKQVSLPLLDIFISFPLCLASFFAFCLLCLFVFLSLFASVPLPFHIW